MLQSMSIRLRADAYDHDDARCDALPCRDRFSHQPYIEKQLGPNRSPFCADSALACTVRDT